MEEEKKDPKYTKEVEVEEFGASRKETAIEKYSATMAAKKLMENIQIVAKKEDSDYNGADNGVRTHINGEIVTEKKSFWGKLKSKITDTFSHADVTPGLISASNGYNEEHSFGETKIEVEKKDGRDRASLSSGYAANSANNQLHASHEHSRKDGSLRKGDMFNVSPVRPDGAVVSSTTFDKEGNRRKNVEISESLASKARTRPDGSVKAREVNLKNDEISGAKVAYEGGDIVDSKPMKPRAAKRFWDRMKAKGDKLVGNILDELPEIANLAGKSGELDLRESRLGEKRARIEEFKQANGLSELKERVTDVSQSTKVMPLGDYFEKSHNLNTLSEEAKAAYMKKVLQPQKE